MDKPWWKSAILGGTVHWDLRYDIKEQIALQPIGYLNEAISIAKHLRNKSNNRYKKQYSHCTSWEQGGTSKKNFSVTESNSFPTNTTSTKGKQIDKDAVEELKAIGWQVTA